jgi:hypothetical protein
MSPQRLPSTFPRRPKDFGAEGSADENEKKTCAVRNLRPEGQTEKISSEGNQMQMTLQEVWNDQQSRKERHYTAGVHRWRFLRRITLCTGEKLLKKKDGTHPEEQEADGGAREVDGLRDVQRRF